MQKEYINNQNIFGSYIKSKKEEESFESVFASIFRRHDYLEEEYGNKIYFQESSTFDNTKHVKQISTIENVNGKINKEKIVNKNFSSFKNVIETKDRDKRSSIDYIIQMNPKSSEMQLNRQDYNGKEEHAKHLDEINDDLITKSSGLINVKNTNSKIKRKIWKRGPYKKRKKAIEQAKLEDKYFPFTKGEGLITTIDDKNYIIEKNQKMEKNKENLHNNTFKINRYFKDSKGKLKKVKKQRKFKSDDIRKKIKVHFHKVIKNIINDNLKKAGSEQLFSFLPQKFLGNVSKKFNKKYMDSTYEDLISKDFTKDQTKNINLEIEQKHYVKNTNVLKYLENNLEISIISGFDKIKRIKYRDLLKSYFLSKEFENTISKLKMKRETDEYINMYILFAKNYISYFSKCK